MPQICHALNSFASGADMLGNLDAYVIKKKYPDVGKSQNGPLLSEILKDYYLGAGISYQSKRYSIFAESIGLNWDGQELNNLDEKMPIFMKDVSNFATLFTAASVKNYSWFELPLADFALIDLLFFSNEKIKEHLNIFFTDLEIKISGE